ncbi:MAG: signal recognition particle protein [Fibrobacterales bacterium]
MFSQLSDRLEGVFKTLKGESKITEENISTALREVRRAFLEADVNFSVTKEFVNAVKEKALGQEVLQSVNPAQMIVKFINDELVEIMGGKAHELQIEGKRPFSIMMVGLQGSGKTTFTGKIALHLRNKKKLKPLLVAADVYRPAAIKQLQILGKSLGIEVFEEGQGDPVVIAKNAREYAIKNEFDVIIYDTAGRLQIDEALMKEVEDIKAAVKPHEIFFVADSMLGQEAVNVSEEFYNRLEFTGICLSKLDGDTRGGAALSIKKVAGGVPIRFIGTGEKLADIEVFYPDRMANRILGMGDVVSLVERAQEVIDEKEAKKLTNRLMSNKFDLEDFLGQLRMIKKLGPLKDIMGMIPGMGKMKDALKGDEFKSIEAILSSMTPKERKFPKVLDASRRRRISRGSGTSVQQVNQVIKQFEDMKKMMKQMTKMTGKMKGGKGGMPNMSQLKGMMGQ